MKNQQFKLTEDHIELLRNSYVGWDDCEFGAPGIDCKRPYGNSGGLIYRDMGNILGIKQKGNVDDDYDPNYGFTDKQIEHFQKLHKELEIALQIVLVTGKFVTGTYEASSYTKNWRKVK